MSDNEENLELGLDVDITEAERTTNRYLSAKRSARSLLKKDPNQKMMPGVEESDLQSASSGCMSQISSIMEDESDLDDDFPMPNRHKFLGISEFKRSNEEPLGYRKIADVKNLRNLARLQSIRPGGGIKSYHNR